MKKKRRVGEVVFIKKTNKKKRKDGKIHLVGYRTMITYGIYQLLRRQLMLMRRRIQYNQIEDIKLVRNNALVIIPKVECGMFGLQSIQLPLLPLCPHQVIVPMQNKYNYQMIITTAILNISQFKRHIIIYYQ